MIYALDITLNGENANRKLIDTMIDQGNSESLKNIVDIPWSKEFLNSYGYLGIGYLRYYLQKQQMLEHCQKMLQKDNVEHKLLQRLKKNYLKNIKMKILMLNQKNWNTWWSIL